MSINFLDPKVLLFSPLSFSLALLCLKKKSHPDSFSPFMRDCNEIPGAIWPLYSEGPSLHFPPCFGRYFRRELKRVLKRGLKVPHLKHVLKETSSPLLDPRQHFGPIMCYPAKHTKCIYVYNGIFLSTRGILFPSNTFPKHFATFYLSCT